MSDELTDEAMKDMTSPSLSVKLMSSPAEARSIMTAPSPG
jgi:hypothetical protein